MPSSAPSKTALSTKPQRPRNTPLATPRTYVGAGRGAVLGYARPRVCNRNFGEPPVSPRRYGHSFLRLCLRCRVKPV